MISEEEINRHCFARTFERAKQIAASNESILTKKCRYSESETTVSAFFVGSKGWNERYRTYVAFDEEDDDILDYSCTCPAIDSYDGMCKHCAALVLSYNEAPERFLGFQKKRGAAHTSASIAAFMERGRQVDRSPETGTVDIEAIVGYGYRSWTAHFKVAGPQGSYVLKSIADFVGRMRRGETFSYGKKLAFTHHPAMLTERAQSVARFLDKAVAAREHADNAISRRYRGREGADRDLDLTEAELIELVDALDGTEFTVEGTDYGVRSNARVHVEHQDPRIDLKLNKVGVDGYSIIRTDTIPFAAHGDRMYVWQDDAFYRCSPEFSLCADFLRDVYDSDDDRLFIACADMPLFCATVLPAIENRLNVQAPSEIEAFRPVPCNLEFFFDRDRKGVSINAQAVYGTRRLPLFEQDAPAESSEQPAFAPLRDERAEAYAKHLVNRYFRYPDQRIPIENDEAVAALVFGGLVEFQAAGTVFTTPAFDRLLTDRKPRVSFGLSLAGNLINLTISSDDLPASEIGPLLASYKKRKRYHRLRSGAFIDLKECDLAELDRIVSDLGISGRQLSAGTVELPSFRAFYLDDELEDARRDESFTRYLENLRKAGKRDYRAPAPLDRMLRTYQLEGFRWLSMLVDSGFGGILADEMGLGKSAQIIALLLARRDEAKKTGPSLIVCPASLVYNWIAEFERFAPGLAVRPIVGTKRERARIRADRTCDVLITSYDLLRIDSADYEGRSFYCCILDEAQYIKNHATLTTRSAKRISASHRFALTGTPMENRLSELWSIFDFLMPGLLGSYMRFRERFELSIMGDDDDAARRLGALVGPFMMRRLKADVLRDLPDKLESVFYAHLEGEQQKLYAAHEQQLRESLTEQRKNRKERRVGEHMVETLAELTRLRQLCCDPRLLYENYTGTAAKLGAIVELVESACDAGEKVLVFSQFTSFLALIAERLDAAGVPYYTLTGSTGKKKRLDLVNAFNEDDTPAFLMSLKAGGTGLNLTGASIVIHADPWWNAAAQAQATDRTHRLGQSKVVSVYKVIAENTIEERILKLQEAKSTLAQRVIGSGDAGVSFANLTEDDLIELLQP